MKQNKKIAVTGGIGSGKSTAMNMISERGYPVFSCDEIYNELTHDPKFLVMLCSQFGDILDSNGCLDRKKLSAIVFNNEEALNKLNKLTHPAVYEELFKRADKLNNSCFCEVPLLFESGAENLFDDVIIVMRDEEARINSVLKRDNLPLEMIEKRVKNQIDYNNLDFTMYYVIHNNGDLASLSHQIDEILRKVVK